MIISGRAWVMGDMIRATDIVAARHDRLATSGKWGECAPYLFEDIDPAFAQSVRPGDVLLAGANFGSGHAHYHLGGIMTARHASVSGIFAESVNGLFQRAAIDHGVPLWAIEDIATLAATGDQVSIDLADGEAVNATTGRRLALPPVSPIILDLLDAGGSRNWALRRVGAEHAIRA